MKNGLATLVTGLVVLTMTACASQPQTLPPGEYKKTEKSVNDAGTETEKTTTTNVYYDAQGNKRAVQETETTTDPEGLFNKNTTRTVKTYN